MSQFFDTWYNSVIGKPVDYDHAYGDQCVDVAMSWSEYCFPPHKWPELLGYGNAKDLWEKANGAYFEKITYSSGFAAKQGDMPIYAGTSGNPDGHIAVVISADATGMRVIEQNGLKPTGVAYTANRPYSNLRGILRPKGVAVETVNKGDVVNYFAAWGKTPSDADFAAWVGKTHKEFNYGKFVPETTNLRKQGTAGFEQINEVLYRKKV